jgi:hypothetical protein
MLIIKESKGIKTHFERMFGVTMDNKERAKSVIFGFVLVGGGLFYFITPLEFVAILTGLMLMGFGIVPEPEEPVSKAAPKKKVVKRTIRQRKVVS